MAKDPSFNWTKEQRRAASRTAGGKGWSRSARNKAFNRTLLEARDISDFNQIGSKLPGRGVGNMTAAKLSKMSPKQMMRFQEQASWMAGGLPEEGIEHYMDKRRDFNRGTGKKMGMRGGMKGMLPMLLLMLLAGGMGAGGNEDLDGLLG